MPTNTTDWGLLTTEEAASMLGRSRWTIARMVKKGDLEPAKIVGNGYLFRPEDIAQISGVERHGAQRDAGTPEGVAGHETALPPNTAKGES